jgi:hypothetical protein
MANIDFYSTNDSIVFKEYGYTFRVLEVVHMTYNGEHRGGYFKLLGDSWDGELETIYTSDDDVDLRDTDTVQSIALQWIHRHV